MREKEDKPGKFFKANFISYIGTKSETNSEYSLHSTTTEAWFPVRLCPGSLLASYPAPYPLELHESCDNARSYCLPSHSRSLRLSPQHSSASNYCFGKRQHHRFLVKKMLTGQPAFAWQPTSDRLNRTDHCWAHHAASPFLGALLGVSLLLLFLFIWFSQNLLGFDQWDFCLSP